MSAGAFSDDKVVEASKKLINIYPDNQQIGNKYGVRFIPAIFFLDPDGNQIEEYKGGRAAADLIKKIDEIAKKHTKDLSWEEDLEKAVETAKEEKKLVLFCFLDNSNQAKNTVKILRDKQLKDELEKVILVKAEFKKDSEEAKKYAVTKAGTVLILNPKEEEDKRIMQKIEKLQSAKELKKIIEGHLKSLE